jgi:hypothetical protein
MPQINYDLYFVETIWPSREKRKGQVDESDWGRYTNTAYNDMRRPGTRKSFERTIGTFDKENADVADVPSRCKDGGAGFTQFRDIAAFTEPEPAIAYARRLAEFGELSAARDHHGESYRGPLRVRVMRETVSTAQTVVHTPKLRKPAPPEAVDLISDEQLRHIADAKDVGAVRERIREALKESTK